jgi:hypothetical protein
MQVTTIGLDIAKSVFQVHGVDRHGTVGLRRRLARAQVLAFFANLPRCGVGLEACGAPLGADLRWSALGARRGCSGRACAGCRSRPRPSRRP